MTTPPLHASDAEARSLRLRTPDSRPTRPLASSPSGTPLGAALTLPARSAAAALLLTTALVASAHVGSPDTFFEGAAGPYPIRVIVRNPGVVPGLAEITVRLLVPRRARRVLVLPVYWDPRTAAPPPPDIAYPVPGDSTLYGAALWLMRSGSYGVQVTVEGTEGTGTALVPVQAVATRRLELQRPLGIALAGLAAVLLAGALTIVRAAVEESVVPPEEAPDRRRIVRGRIATVVSAMLLGAALVGGRAWWNQVDAAYRSGLDQPVHATAALRAAGAERVLRLAIDDTSWTSRTRQWTPLVPDHGHLMHLFLIPEASLDAFAHLHPLPLDSVTFEARLPPVPPGRYRIYADVVHESGFAQTLVAMADIDAPATAWRPSDPDDAWISGKGKGETGNVVTLADGSTMTWERGDAPILVNREAPLRFLVTAPDGAPATLEPYMGMAGHAMIARDDGAVFAHLHPAGTISMAAQATFLLRQPGDTVRGALGRRLAERATSRTTMADTQTAATGTLSFPYAFPKPGRYRIWIQVKRAGRILTGAFEANVL